MGILETEARTIRRRGYLQNAVLATIAIGGILALTMVAPNALQLLGGIGKKKRFNEQAQRAASRLAQKGYIRFVEIGGRKHLEITDAGKRALELAEVKQKQIAEKSHARRWDGRWRMVIFDISENRRAVRDRLRSTVQSIGFLRLQNSAWIYPYDCEELLILLKADLKIGKDVLYVIVEKVENDGWIKRHFKLR